MIQPGTIIQGDAPPTILENPLAAELVRLMKLQMEVVQLLMNPVWYVPHSSGIDVNALMSGRKP